MRKPEPRTSDTQSTSGELRVKQGSVSDAEEGTTNRKPEAPTWLVENIAEASKNASQIHLLYLSFLAYCTLTVVSTSDRQLILNEATILPVLNVTVPLVSFFVLGPVVALSIFVYFQLYLFRINNMTTYIHTNYTPLEKGRLYPWMITIAKEPEKGFIGKLQTFIVKCTLWWLLPVVLILFELWIVKINSSALNYFACFMILLSTCITLMFWQKYEPSRYIGKILLSLMSMVFFLFIPLFIIHMENIEIPTQQNHTSKFSSMLMKHVSRWRNLDLSYQKLIVEPSKPEQDYEEIYWLNLKDVYLKGTRLSSAVLKRANLQNAHLQDVMLNNANLERVNFTDAKIQRADLTAAMLHKANFTNATLIDTIFERARLEEANFENVRFKGVNFEDANLKNANLLEAQLASGKLRVAQLQGALLIFACLRDANLQGANLQGAKLSLADLGRAKLQGANLEDALLQSANLAGADLMRVNLKNAKLEDANLEGANLQEATITFEQLSQVKTLYKAQVDTSLRAQIAQTRSNLLQASSPTPGEAGDSRKAICSE